MKMFVDVFSCLHSSSFIFYSYISSPSTTSNTSQQSEYFQMRNASPFFSKQMVVLSAVKAILSLRLNLSGGCLSCQIGRLQLGSTSYFALFCCINKEQLDNGGHVRGESRAPLKVVVLEYVVSLSPLYLCQVIISLSLTQT